LSGTRLLDIIRVSGGQPWWSAGERLGRTAR
jgi:hypothetical protein